MIKKKAKRPRLTRISEEKTSGTYPGYPYYVSPDDVNKTDETSNERKENEIKQGLNEKSDQAPLEDSEDPADQFILNAEDMIALGPKDLSMDGGDDELLAHRDSPVDFTGDDLDVPGAELDDESESIGSEDEENNSYSLGGDDHNDLEESKP
jgi:hypothetical protein